MNGTRPSFPKINVPPCVVSQPSILSHWRYEARREAQLLFDTLWLGPLGVSKDEGFLVKNNIRVLISLMDPRAQPHKFMDHSEIRFHHFDPGDHITTSLALVKQFDTINQLLDQYLVHGVGVLLFCETGNDKSATVASAYTMHRFDYDYVKGIQAVQSKRFSISLDDASKYVLLTYDELRKAKKDCQNTPDSDMNGAGNNGTGKRQLEDDDDDEEALIYDTSTNTTNSPKKQARDDDIISVDDNIP